MPQNYGPLTAVGTRASRDNEPEWSSAQLIGSRDGWDWWEAKLNVPSSRVRYRWYLRHADGQLEWLSQSGLSQLEVTDAEDFVVIAYPAPPRWLFDAVMYQIFPDRFARSASADDRELPDWAIPAAWTDPVDAVMPGRSMQIYGGDLEGIVDKLDYLEQLGINLIYLTPFFPGRSNHRYDAASFTSVDDLLGGNEALSALVEAAHRRGIRVIGDLTTNHSGIGHEWFQSAFQNPGSSSESFYYFTDDGNSEYVCWLGEPSLPKFDWASPELRGTFVSNDDSIVRRWLKEPYGLDGWRLDVANMTGRLGDIDHNAEVRQLLRASIREVSPEAIMIAEVTNDIASDLQGDGADGAMTYPAFTRPLWMWLSEQKPTSFLGGDGSVHTKPWFFGLPIDSIPRYNAHQFVDSTVRFTAQIPWRVRLGNMQALDTHDTGRFATAAAPGTIPVAVGLSMTLPGVPVLFMGDEFGLTGEDGELSRTPIPWQDQDDPAVAEHIQMYRELIGIRRAHPVLSTGGLRWLAVDDAGFAFIRESVEECVLVVACREDFAAQLPAASLPSGAARSLYGDASLSVGDDGSARVSALGPSFAAWVLPGVVAPAA